MNIVGKSNTAISNIMTSVNMGDLGIQMSYIAKQLLNTAKLYNCRCETRIAKYCQVKLSQIRGKDNFRESGRWGHLCSNRASGQGVLTKIVSRSQFDVLKSMFCWWIHNSHDNFVAHSSPVRRALHLIKIRWSWWMMISQLRWSCRMKLASQRSP